MKRIRTAIRTIVASLVAVALAGAQARPDLVPWPQEIAIEGGRLELTTDSRIVAGSTELGPLADLLADEVHLTTGLRLRTGGTAGGPDDIALRLSDGSRGEAHRVDVTDRVVVSGAASRRSRSAR